MKTIRIATRKSPLALWQAHFIGQSLQKIWPDVQYKLLPLLTSGDRFLKDSLKEKGGKGLFVKELETALLNEQADLAVHSMKDVPSTFPAGLYLPVICQRESPADAFISKPSHSLATLPSGSIIGTASLRRQAQLLAYRPDLHIKTLRGNVQTRLKKLQEGEFDAIILAAAGLERLQLNAMINHYIDASIMLPACGQGALGIEIRCEDNPMRALLQPLHHEISASCVHAERHVNYLLGGNCHVPLAVHGALCSPEEMVLEARVLNASGTILIQNIQRGKLQDALYLAEKCAYALLQQGAQELLNGA